MVTLILDDTSDAILIGEDGEPVPSPELLRWLNAACPEHWSYRYDGAWNVFFTFEDEEVAAHFKGRFGAREAGETT